MFSAPEDPLDQVALANSPDRPPPYDASGYHSNNRRNNIGSLFAQETFAHQVDATANLLANAERLSPYREIPNVFPEAVQQMVLDSVRTNEMDLNTGDPSERTNQNGSDNHASNYSSNPFMDIPPQQRLFADNPSASSVQHGHQSASHILFNQSVPVHHGNSEEAIRNSGGRNQGRQLQGASSAPASIDGGNHCHYPCFKEFVLQSFINYFDAKHLS